jgi:hypothetical protein
MPGRSVKGAIDITADIATAVSIPDPTARHFPVIALGGCSVTVANAG